MIDTFRLSGVTLTTLLVWLVTLALNFIGISLDAVTATSVTALVASALNAIQRWLLPQTLPDETATG